MARVKARSRSMNGGAAGNRNGGELHAPKITWVERERIAKQNRALLDRDLLERRLVFESRPYEAHVGFSNFCNMSCIMCWDGENPPLQKMEPEVLEKVATQVAPALSVITPHSGSEPLVASWDETISLARDYSVQLALTTNVQFLDEPKFHELKDHVEMVVMSIDSHQPELFTKIRPGAKADKVFENLPRAAKLCEEHGIECIVQAVFMTENAPTMPETIAYMADAGVQAVNVIQLIDINGRSGYLDPSLHFSSQYIEWIRQKCVAVAKEKRIRLGWDLSGVTWLDFREPTRKIRPRRSKWWNDSFDHLMKLRNPGFCKYAYDRLLIETSGVVAPCGLASDGELNLGDLATQDFDEIWNGPSAQDLRRGHYTWDYPSLCKTCRFVDRIGPQPTLPFVRSLLNDRGLDEQEVDAALVMEEPAHMERSADAPTLRFRPPDRAIAHYVVAFSLGGEPDHVVTSEFEPSPAQGGLLEWTLPAELWAQLDTNLGWWWCVFAVSGDELEPDVRSSELRCVIRHEEIARIEGSSMGYPDEGHIPIAYMGGERQVGWGQPDALPARPVVRERTEFVRQRHTKRERSEPQDGTDSAIDR